MKILLVAINAKFTHSNLAVHSLKVYADHYFSHINPDMLVHMDLKPKIVVQEYTINQNIDTIMSSIYQENADILCFSCYIWNIGMIRNLIDTFATISPKLAIWLGGPEVSYQTDYYLEQYDNVTEVVSGEGEFDFVELICEYLEHKTELHFDIRPNDIVEIEGHKNFSCVPFPYHDLTLFQHRILYYESSRGCPYRCSYCISSVEASVTFRDMEFVQQELQFFLDHKVPQVKFVDRTFNCNHSHSMAIWQYLKQHDNGVTNFHFEIKADLLTDEELSFLRTLRPHLLQFEIGVQSTNPNTLQEIRRITDFDKLYHNVKELRKGRNIHLHLDLIAGLPYENLKRFRTSFNDVMNLRPNQLQLGFLKVLSGSHMEEMKDEYQLVARSYAPYEILQNRWMSYNDLQELKLVEQVVELYYNSESYQKSLDLLCSFYLEPYSFYLDLGRYYVDSMPQGMSANRVRNYEILLKFGREVIYDYTYNDETSEELLDRMFLENLIHDFYRKDHVKNRPAFAGEDTVSKERKREFYDQEDQERNYLIGYESYDKRQMRNMTHLEQLEEGLYLFDYLNRDPYTQQARVILVDAK